MLNGEKEKRIESSVKLQISRSFHIKKSTNCQNLENSNLIILVAMF